MSTRERKNCSIKDIAKLANVSHTTVSRALNGNGRISNKKCDEIKEIAKRLNYFPNQAARSLQTSKTRTIGVLLNFLGNIFSGEILLGIENVAEKNGYVLLFGDSKEDVDRESKYLHAFIQHGVDGIIYYPVFDPGFSKNVELLNEVTIPFIMVDKYSPEVPGNFVTCDDEAGGFLATEHLIKSGNKTIGMLRGPSSSSMDARFEGYKRALAHYGIPFEPGLVDIFTIEKINNRVSSYSAAMGILGAKSRIDSLFVASDEAMPDVFRAVGEKGLHVPRDLSIIGYGDIYQPNSFKIPLSTIGYPKREVGSRAITELIKIINNETIALKQIKLAPKLLLRGSC